MAQLIVKDNALIEASYTLDLAEQRLILLAILEAREQQTLIQAGSLLRIHASSYINQFEVENIPLTRFLKKRYRVCTRQVLLIARLMNAQANWGITKAVGDIKLAILMTWAVLSWSLLVM